MFRWLTLLGGLFLVVLWMLFFRAIFALIVVGGLLLVAWVWWEIRGLRRVMRNPPPK